MEKMKASEYEKLMLIGWRRCGTYFYRPLLDVTCCPQYSIRLQVERFQPSKSQKKVLKNVQKKIHKDDESNDIEITMELASFTVEKFELYKQYQISIHGDKVDEITPEGFSAFLVTSALYDEDSSSNKVYKYGTYHQLYRYKGNLVAVGVVDLLPSGLSSVYCFYNSELRDLTLGKYSALKEIQWCIDNNFDYYYMGFYIHDCDKMKYKGEYKPSQLLCPGTLDWFDLEQCVPLLDINKFTPFSKQLAEERKASSSLNQYVKNLDEGRDIGEAKLQISSRIVPYRALNPRAKDILDEKFFEFLQLTGPEFFFSVIIRV